MSIITSSERLTSRLSRTYFVVHALARCFCTMWPFLGCKVPIPLSAYSLKCMKSVPKWQNDRGMLFFLVAGVFISQLFITKHKTRPKIACERQTYFRSSLLSLLLFGGREATTGNASAVRRLDQKGPIYNPHTWMVGTYIRPSYNSD